MELLKRILRWGLLPMSLLSNGIGYYLDSREILEFGLPSWAWYLIGYGLLLLFFIFVIVGFWRENKNLKKKVDTQISENIREAQRLEKKNLRLRYKQAESIPDKLYELFKVSKNISLETYKENMLDGEKLEFVLQELYEANIMDDLGGFFVNVANADDYSNLEKIISKVDVSAVWSKVAKIILFIQNAMTQCESGISLFIPSNTTYGTLYTEIMDLKNLVPNPIQTQIVNYINCANGVNNLRYIDIYKLNERNEGGFVSPLGMLMMPQLEESMQNYLSPINAEIRSNIDNYLLGY